MAGRRQPHPWTQLLDDLGHVFRESRFMRLKFFCSTLNYADRAMFAAFIYLNGLGVNWILDVLASVNIHANPYRLNQISAVVEWLENNPERHADYYALNLQEGHVTNLLGEHRDAGTGRIYNLERDCVINEEPDPWGDDPLYDEQELLRLEQEALGRQPPQQRRQYWRPWLNRLERNPIVDNARNEIMDADH